MKRGIALREREIKELKEKILRANNAIGIKEVFTYEFPDNRFDAVPLLDIVKLIEVVKATIKPDIIFTHYEKDLNIDHRITYQALLQPQDHRQMRQ